MVEGSRVVPYISWGSSLEVAAFPGVLTHKDFLRLVPLGLGDPFLRISKGHKAHTACACGRSVSSAAHPGLLRSV